MPKRFKIGEEVKITKGAHRGERGVVRGQSGTGHKLQWLVSISGAEPVPIANVSVQQLGSKVLKPAARASAAAPDQESDSGESEQSSEGEDEDADEENTGDEAGEGPSPESAAASPGAPASAAPPPAGETVVNDVRWTHLEDITVDACTFTAAPAFHARPPLTPTSTLLDVFLATISLNILNTIVSSTNANGLLPQMTLEELVCFLGLILGMSSLSLPRREAYWAPYDPSAVNPSPDYGRFMRWERFKRILTHLRLTSYTQEQEQADPWVPIRGFLNMLNEHLRQLLAPGRTLCVDESFSKWRGLALKLKVPGGDDVVTVGLPHQQKEKRKPEGVGVEFKTLCCATTGFMLRLELNEGKDVSAQLDFYSEFGATTATVLRLCERYKGSGRVVVGDSWFASVKTAVALHKWGLYFIGPIKTATRSYPKAFLLAQPLSERGKHFCLQATHEGVHLTALVWRDKKTKLFVATCGATIDSPDPIVRERLRFEGGQVVSKNLTVQRPMLVKDYFDAAKAIDVHNHLRQGTLALERNFGTHTWWHRVFLTLIGVVVTNSYRAFVHFHPARSSVGSTESLSEFKEELAEQMVRNSLASPERRSQKRAPAEEDDLEEAPPRGHVVESLRKHPDYRTKSGSGVPVQLTCSICRKKASFYCVFCFETTGFTVTVCNPTKDRSGCLMAHEKRAKLT